MIAEVIRLKQMAVLHIFPEMERLEVSEEVVIKVYRNILSSGERRGTLWRYWEINGQGSCSITVSSGEGRDKICVPSAIQAVFGRYLRLPPKEFDCHSFIEALFWEELKPGADGFRSPFAPIPEDRSIGFSPCCLLDKHRQFVHSFLQITPEITLSKIGSMGFCVTTHEELLALYSSAVEVAVLKPVPR